MAQSQTTVPPTRGASLLPPSNIYLWCGGKFVQSLLAQRCRVRLREQPAEPGHTESSGRQPVLRQLLL